MNFTKRLRSLDILGGQHAPKASSGSGFQILYQCPDCQGIWLQDGVAVLLDLTADQIADCVQKLSADLLRMPQGVCRLCLWRNGSGRVEIDQYCKGEGFGFCWELPHPLILHATSAILPASGKGNPLDSPEVLTRYDKLRIILQAVEDAPAPRSSQEIPSAFCAYQARVLRPGFGQTGTKRWQWQGYVFALPWPPLQGEAIVTFLLALPPTERLLLDEAFEIWQALMRLTRLCGLPQGAPGAPEKTAPDAF